MNTDLNLLPLSINKSPPDHRSVRVILSRSHRRAGTKDAASAHVHWYRACLVPRRFLCPCLRRKLSNQQSDVGKGNRPPNPCRWGAGAYMGGVSPEVFLFFGGAWKRFIRKQIYFFSSFFLSFFFKKVICNHYFLISFPLPPPIRRGWIDLLLDQSRVNSSFFFLSSS